MGVQSLVEHALSEVADEPIEACCAGRTDTGVHAEGQVMHIDTTAQRSERGWVLGANSNLPDDVNARWARQVDSTFNARFSAISRSYRYLILNRLVRSALYRHRAWWVHQPLNEKDMQHAAACLLGQHDFSAFRAAGCQASTPVREVREVSVVRDGDWITIDITANAFLQHMVRNIAGVLVAIGQGDEDPDWAEEVLERRDRTRGGIAAPAHGLTLMRVEYPEHFNLPVYRL